MTRRTPSSSGTFTTTETTDINQSGSPTIGDITDQVKGQAGQVADQARTQVTSQLSGQKDRAAEGLNNVAHMLRQTSQQMRDQDQGAVTPYVDNIAGQVERVASYIQNRDVGQLVNEVERFARRQPVLFLSSAFTLGLLGARFLKSSSQPTYGYGGSDYPLARRDDYLTRPLYDQTSTSTYPTGATTYGTGRGTTGTDTGYDTTTGTPSIDTGTTYDTSTRTRDTDETERL